MRQTIRACPERTRKAGPFSCSVSPLVVRQRSGGRSRRPHAHVTLDGRAPRIARGGPTRSSGLRLPRDLHRHLTVGRRAVAQLSREVVAPAIREAGERDAAGMVETCAEAREREPTAYGDRERTGAGGVVAERAAAPAVRIAARRHTARVTAPRADGAPAQRAGNGDRDGAAGC